MRFDDPEHLEQWQKRGEYPPIHSGIFHLAVDRLKPECRVVDLCCSTGLLGQHLRTRGFEVLGLDGDEQVVRIAAQYGIPVKHFKIEAHDLKPLLDAFEWFGAHALVARRCIPELFSSLEAAKPFAKGLRDIGVTQLVLQGRAPTRQAVHTFASVDQEIEVFEDCYDVQVVRGQCAYLLAP